MKKVLTALMLFVGSLAIAQSTTTPNVGLEVPPIGSNNWGVPLNYNFNKLDQLLSGKLPLPALNVTGNVTLPNLVLTQAQINAAIGYTPLNPTNNLSDVASTIAALANIGGIGSVSVKGTWSAGQSYNATDVVLYNGGTYISIASANFGNQPDISPSKWTPLVIPQPQVAAVTLRVASGIALTTGNTYAYLQVNYSGTIVGWSIIADQPGSISIDVWKIASSAPPSIPSIPSSANLISASAPVSLSSAQAASTDATGVSTWNTAVNAYDVFGFNITSSSTVKSVTVQLFIVKN